MWKSLSFIVMCIVLYSKCDLTCDSNDDKGEYTLECKPKDAGDQELYDNSIFSDIECDMARDEDDKYIFSAKTCSITSITKDLFSEVQCITIIDLSNNFLSEIPEETFNGLKRLRKIDLSYNQLKNIAKKTFSELPELKELNLSNNLLKITSVDAGIFRTTNIKILNMSHNEEIYLSAVIKDLNPTHLYLSHSKVILTNNIFMGKNTEGLLRLEMSNTSLSNLPNNIFHPLKNLNLLDLSHNNLKELDDDSFAHLIKLKVLVISHNKLESTELSFDGNVILNNLDLSFNEFGNLERNVFIKNINLVKLSLNDNKLTSIPEIKFLSKLEYLDISNNPLTHLDKNVFDSNTELKVIYLRNIKLKNIKKKFFDHNVYIRTLDLSNNNLQKLDKNIFKNNNDLQTINLRNNELNNFEDNFYIPERYLKTLDISCNKITLLPVKMLTSLSKITVLLHGNPISCIQLKDILNSLQKLSREHFIRGKTISCLYRDRNEDIYNKTFDKWLAQNDCPKKN